MTLGQVYIGKIIELEDIDNADFLDRVTVICGKGGKWSAVVKKGDFSEGNLCEVYLQDSLLPEEDRFSFMESNGYRVRMMRLRGVPSECLVMPLTVDGDLGDDITEEMGVTKYSKPVPVNMSGELLSHFPSFIPKTDEPNFQTVPHFIEALQGKSYYVTEKADGSSGTAYYHDGHFGCCSRNYELVESDDNAVWHIAREYNLREILGAFGSIAIQFEVVGPKIQGNPLGLDSIEPRLFSVYFIDGEHEYGSYDQLELIQVMTNMPMAKLIEAGLGFDYKTEDELRELARGKYANGNDREGVVVRPIRPMRVDGEFLSFKVVNLDYRD